MYCETHLHQRLTVTMQMHTQVVVSGWCNGIAIKCW